MPKIFNRIKETSTSIGTGDFVLGGAAASDFFTFSSVLSDNDKFYYEIDQVGVACEQGIGTYHSGANSFTRTTVKSGSNGTSAVNFTSGSKDVFISYISEIAVMTDNPNTFTVGPQTIQTGADANKGLIIKANSASQSADLIQCQDVSGNPQVEAKTLYAPTLPNNLTKGGALSLADASGTTSVISASSGFVDIVPDSSKSAVGLRILTYGLFTSLDLFFQFYGPGPSGDVVFEGTTCQALFFSTYNGGPIIFGPQRLEAARVDSNGRFGVGTTGPAAQLHARASDATTSALTTVQIIGHHSTGTPAAGFGSALQFQLDSSTTADRNAAEIDVSWATATDASRKGRMTLSAWDATAAREGLRVETDGTQALLGMYGAAALAKQTVTGSKGANAALASLITALANLGLITDSTT